MIQASEISKLRGELEGCKRVALFGSQCSARRHLQMS